MSVFWLRRSPTCPTPPEPPHRQVGAVADGTVAPPSFVAYIWQRTA